MKIQERQRENIAYFRYSESFLYVNIFVTQRRKIKLYEQ